MKPLRFILCWAVTYGLTLGTITFFLFAAVTLRREPLLFVGMLLGEGLLVLGSWLYVRGVGALSRRQALEVVIAWMTCSVLADLVVLVVVRRKSVFDLTSLSLWGYALDVLVLCVVVLFLQKRNAPVHSPDLLGDA